jgi:hypothetical protein
MVKAILTTNDVLVNFNNIVNVYIYTPNTMQTRFQLRAACLESTTEFDLAVYESKADALTALQIICDFLGSDEAVLDLNFPDEDDEEDYE